MNQEEFKILMDRYTNGDFGGEELMKIRVLLNDPVYREYLDEYMKVQHIAHDPYYGIPGKKVLLLIEKFILSKIENPEPRIHILKNKWFRYAAILLLIAGAGVYFFNKENNAASLAGSGSATLIKQDIGPGKSGAMLTLADGTTILLDSAGNGNIANQSGTKILLKNGQLAYNAAGASSVNYNIVSTPRGRQFQLLLADGTKVWLNAASSLKYPTAFTGAERKVEITGEAYFEVAADSRLPFVVLSGNGSEVQVLGTSFNIMAYQEEKEIQTTLIEGSVKVVKKDKSVMLLPGQQALLNGEDALSINKDEFDLDEVVGWKNGFFIFDNTDLDVIMRRISRWYDVEVIYTGSTSGRHYTGSVRSNSKVSDVLRKIELAGGVSFDVQDRKIIVKLK